MNNIEILKLAENFEKLSIIKKEKGKYIIYSKKNKKLGEYDTEEQALKRLKQIEFFTNRFYKRRFFKNKKASSAIEVDHLSYSAIIRKLRQKDKDMMKDFQKYFYECFNKLILDSKDKPELTALAHTLKYFKKEYDIVFEKK